MNLLRLLGAASSTIVLLSACTSSTPSETVGTGDSGSGGSASTSGTGSGEVTGSAWKAAPDQVFGEIALASAGHEEALVYVESIPAGSAGVFSSVIKLQRLEATGARRGDAIELGHASSTGTRLTITSDGARYLACWDDAGAGQISCALAPVAEGPSHPALSLAGLWPSLAHGAGGWTLAYGLPGYAAVAHIADDGSAIGAPALFTVDKASSPRALIAATPNGFALVSAPEHVSGKNVYVHRLDSAFTPIGAPIDLGMKLWIRNAVAVAVNGATIAVSISEPYDSHVFILAGGVIINSHFFSGGGKVGPKDALIADGASIGRLAQDDGTSPFMYTTIEGDKLTATPQKPEVDHALGYYDGAFAVTQVGTNRLYAATAGANDELVVAGIQRP
jgi:hypothetical protein